MKRPPLLFTGSLYYVKSRPGRFGRTVYVVVRRDTGVETGEYEEPFTANQRAERLDQSDRQMRLL
jgi:hypothetical protein